MQEYSLDEILMSGFTLVKSVVYDADEKKKKGGKTQELVMRYNGPYPTICPECGSKLYAHTPKTVKYTDTPFTGLPTKLKLELPRRRCSSSDCPYLWHPEPSNVHESHMMTERAFNRIADLATKRSFNDIASEYGISVNTAKSVFVDRLTDQKQNLRFKTPAFLGLDEIKIKKVGEVTVITDLEHKTMYDMLHGRNQISLTQYFSEIPNPENVIWVCTDMYRPFEKSIKTALPNARWVIDHYHVVAYANRAMDKVRIKLQYGMDKRNRISTKKGLAYTLRTRLKNLTPEDALKIKACREDPELNLLAVAFDLKEDFFNIYDENKTSKANAQQAFTAWENSIPEDEAFDDFRELAKTVHNFYEQIFNYWDCPILITNGFTECSNRIIRENNVRGRGNSFEILRGRTLYRQANLERIEASGMMLGPPISKKGPVFHYEEVKGIEDAVVEDESEYFNSFDYDPMIGLIPGVNYDPDTGEIFDETLFGDDEEDDLPFI